MEVRLHDTLDAFRRLALEVYRRDPVRATVELMVLTGEVVDRNPAPRLITVHEGSETVGAAFQTLRSPLLCGGLPETAVATVVAALAAGELELNGVHGPRDIATAFADAWCAARGVHGVVRSEERLHRLDQLHPPRGVVGEYRHADAGDTTLIEDWLNRFRAEALGMVADPGADAPPARTAKGPPDRFLLWTVDGAPVSVAGVRLPIAGVSRIGPVYTPAERRSQGFGSAATAAAATWAHSAGAVAAVLFTDLTKPGVGRVYERLGFVPVCDFVRIDFSPR